MNDPTIMIAPTRIQLRWRFDYATRPSRYGSWDCEAKAKAWLAAYQPKDGLTYAWIEGRSPIVTTKVFPVLRTDGPDYVACQGEAELSLGSGRTRFLGLSFITRDEKITAFVDGSITRRPLTDEEKKFKFQEHSAGS